MREEQCIMTSLAVRAPYYERCVVCGRRVRAREARLVDICGPVYICSRCPDPDTRWLTWQETPGGEWPAVNLRGVAYPPVERRTDS